MVMRGLLWYGKTNFIKQRKKQLPNLSYNHSTLITLRTSVKESLQMHLCSKELPCS